jgi:hypothetical protein
MGYLRLYLSPSVQPSTTSPQDNVRAAGEAYRPTTYTPASKGGLLDSFAGGGMMGHRQEEPRLSVPFAPGAQPQNTGSREKPPASHVGRPHSSHAVGPRLSTAGNGTVTITGIFKDVHGSPDVLPDRVRPRGEPTEESDSPPKGKGRRKGPRRRGR